MDKKKKAKAPPRPTWQNRITGYGTEDPEQLVANPLNWRIHPTSQQDVLRDVLTTIGWVDEVIVNQRTGFVVDGHLRVALALREGEQSVPVKYVDLSEREERMVLAVLDPIAAMAVTDDKKYHELLNEIADGDGIEAYLEEAAKAAGIDLPDSEFPPHTKNEPETPGEAAAYATCPKCGHRFLYGQDTPASH
jgi:hypothetical protein